MSEKNQTKRGSKLGQKKIPKYVSDVDKKNHFVLHANKCVKLIDRQLVKLAKVGKARTFVYTPEQVIKIQEHLNEQVQKTVEKMLGKVETKESFNVGL
jgi:hypothetical protein